MNQAHKRDLTALALLTVVVLAVFWKLLPSQWQANQNYDYMCCYEPVARNWLAGKGWTFDNGNFGGSYPPGYPVAIMAVKLFAGWTGSGEETAMRWLILLCTIATVLAMHAIGSAMGGLRLGRAAAVSTLCYPFFLWLAKQPNSETLFIPFLAASVYAYVRMVQATSSAALWRWAAICGLISGLASLIRPISVFTGVVLAISAWYALRRTFPHGHRAAMVLLVCGVNLLVVLPWELEVHSKKGGWPLLADNGGISFLQGMTFGLEKPDLKASPVSADVRALMERADAREREIRTIGGLLRFLAEEAVRNPATFAKLMWLKTTRVWYATHSTRDKETSTILIQAAFLTLACAGLWKLRTRAPAEVFGITMFTLYFWAMSALVLPLLRYMVPVTVVLAVGVGAVFVFLVDRMSGLKTATALFRETSIE